jgi:hypothetical protein
MSGIKNVIIKSTKLGIEEHGIFTAYLHLEGDGWGCGFGGYAMDTWIDRENKRVGTRFGCDFITGVLKTLEVDSWENLKGKMVRAETEGWGGKILRIGHPIKDIWFDPKQLAKELT